MGSIIKLKDVSRDEKMQSLIESKDDKMTIKVSSKCEMVAVLFCNYPFKYITNECLLGGSVCLFLLPFLLETSE